MQRKKKKRGPKLQRVFLSTFQIEPTVFLHLIRWNQLFCVYLRLNNELSMANNEKMEALNRLKVVLVEKGKTSRWLAEQLGKTEHTISRWCQNKTQPSIAQLNEIAKVLMIDVRSLINPSQEKYNEL